MSSTPNKDQRIRELEQQVHDLQQSNHDLEHFAYVASHDLQAPLRTVEGYLGLIQKLLPEAELSPELVEYFSHVSLGMKRLQTLIKDLLEYSRAGRLEDQQTIQSIPLLEIIKYNLRAAIAQGQVTITTEGLPEVFHGHRTGITQLWQNMLANAIRYGKESQPNLIHFSAQATPTHWHFSLADQGVGIAPANHQRIFELFTHLSPRDIDDPSTGIGLALCKRIVESHGGRIWVESELGAGAVFHFTLKR